MSNLRKRPTTEAEIVRCAEDPLYYYNAYLRLDHEPTLTQEELDQRREEFVKERAKHLTPEQIQEMRDKQAEATFKNRPSVIDTAAKVIGEEAKGLKNKAAAKKEKKAKNKIVSRVKNRLAKKSRKNNRKK